jgi:hypothetical protein
MATIKKYRPGAMAYPCNPSYLGGRYREDQISSPAQAKS